MKKMHYKYSPNGNIQKTTVTYSKITKEELEKIIKQKELKVLGVSLWMSDNDQCKTVIITQVPKEH